MTKKDHKLLANAIRTFILTVPWSSERRGVMGEFAHNLADVLAEENPRFDRGKFLNACNLIK